MNERTMNTHIFKFTIEGIVDDAHLDAIVDLINSEAYVSDITKQN